VVAVGGGRGLTAELVTALAEVSRPTTVYVLNRTAPAANAEVPDRATYMAAERAARPGASVAGLLRGHQQVVAAAETRRTLDRLRVLCGPDAVHHVVCNVTNARAVSAAADRIHAAHGRIGILINAAGLHHGGTVRTTSLDRIREVRDTKLLGY